MKAKDEFMDKTIKGLEDTMWRMFWKGNQIANLDTLEEYVYRLIRATTQKMGSTAKTKDSAWRESRAYIDWDMLDLDLITIAMEATALVLDPRFDELKEAWRKGEPFRGANKSDG